MACVIKSQENIDIIPYSNKEKKIDANFSDWEDGKYLILSNFIQVSPIRNIQPSYNTIVYACYDRNFLFFYVQCIDDKAKEIVATSHERDSEIILNDDSFQMLLDCYGTKSKAYYFGVNPFGTQYETSLIGGGAMYSDWNGKWYSASKIDSTGWITEISIPFTSLDFGKKLWSIQLIRHIARKKEYSCYKSAESTRSFNDMGLIKFENYEIIKKVNWLYITPSFITTLDTFETKNFGLGGLIRIEPYDNTAFELTYHPDYAEIEADIDYIDLDQLPLYLAEKRDFFMRDREYIYDPLKIFYTRSIQDINYGTKISSKLFDGKLVSNNWFINDKEGNYYLTNRINYYPIKGQGLGLMFVNNNKGDSIKSSSVSIDGSFSLPWKTHLNVQSVYSKYDQGNIKKDDYAILINPYRIVNKGWDISGVYKKIGENFNSVTGYIPQKGIDIYNLDLGYIFRFPKNSFFRRIYTGLGTNYWDTKGIGTEKFEYYFSTTTSTSDNMFYSLNLKNQERKTRSGTIYRNKLLNLNIEYSPGGWNSLYGGIQYGKYYDGIMYYPNIGFDFKPFKTFNFSISAEYFYVKYNHEPNTKEFIIYTRSEWEIIHKLSLKSFVQWSDLSKEMDINLLLKYDFFAGSHIYFAFNDVRALNSKKDQMEHGKYDFQTINNKMLFKITYQFTIM